MADEDFDGRIVRGVLARSPDVDLVDVHAVGLARTNDRIILKWAASDERIVLTHDENTMIGHAYTRIEAGLPMPGLVVIPQVTPIGAAIESLLVLLGASTPDDLRGRVIHLPL